MRAPKKSLRFIVSLHGMSAKREPLYTCWPTSSSSVSLTKMHSPEAEALRHSSISWQDNLPPLPLVMNPPSPVGHEPTKVARAALSSGTTTGGGSLWKGIVIACAGECLGHAAALAELSASELTCTCAYGETPSHSAVCAGTSVDMTTMRLGQLCVMRWRSSSRGPRSDRHALWARAK